MMMMPVPAAPDNAGPCPSDEEVAAFIDGMLHGEERERLIDHLASCKACYEVFAGVMSFEQEVAGAGKGGRIVPFPVAKREEKKDAERKERRRPAVLRWLPAAAAVLAIGIAYEGYRTPSAPPPITVASLTEPLESRPEAAQSLYPFVRLRGEGSQGKDLLAGDRPSFMVGVLLIDLRLAAQAQNPQATIADLLDQISTRIDEAGYAKPLADRYRQDALKAKTSVAFARQIEAELPRREADLDSSLDADSLAFGKWAEACRLAAISKTPEFFTGRNNRSFLSRTLALKEKEVEERGTPAKSEDELDLMAERESAVVEILRRIAADWKRGDPPQSYQAVAEDFGKLIGLYDR